jgi:hypothetical protein
LTRSSTGQETCQTDNKKERGQVIRKEGEHIMPKEHPYTADMMMKINDFDPKIIELNNKVLFGVVVGR